MCLTARTLRRGFLMSRWVTWALWNVWARRAWTIARTFAAEAEGDETPLSVVMHAAGRLNDEATYDVDPEVAQAAVQADLEQRERVCREILQQARNLTPQ